MAVTLDPRAQHLLKTLVERYIAEGQPVGSRALSRQSGLELSPATIRNVMADLEEMGFIASPHTSAGRVPTPKGYRFFVDSLMVVKPLEPSRDHAARGRAVADRPQQLVSAAASLLSQLTHFAGVVVTPQRRERGFRHLEFLRLSDRRVLLIIVTPEGDVQNRILHTDRTYSQSQLVEATNFFNQHFAGQPFAAIRARLADELRELREDIAALMTAAVDAGEGALDEGRRRWSSPASATCCRPRTSRRTWSGCGGCSTCSSRRPRCCTCSTSRSARRACRSTSAASRGSCRSTRCSVVTAPYEVDGQVIGTLGVIGPTRMAYERVIPIVDVTAKLLSNALTQQLDANG